jgi:adenosylmethionine-8-amino-7-oxononanoate aminotransferase
VRSNSLQELDRRHWIHPLSQWRDHERNGVNILRSAKGVFLSGDDGVEMLDGFAGLWCVNVGYGQESIVEAASKQMRELPYATSYFGSGAESAIRLAASLGERAPGDCTHVFFTLGGSDSVDTAVRFVQYYYHITGKPEKRHFIALDRGYHGTSTTVSGLTAIPIFQKHFDSPSAYQHHIPSPYPYRHDAGPDGNAIIAACTEALRTKVEEIGVSNVAAFICEPIQGSGGIIVPPPGFLSEMRKVCRELNILFIVDEVITGFGRTGPLFACETESIAPDLMTVAKGLTAGYVPMGAVFISDRIYQEIADSMPPDSPFGHGSTYSGHPVSAAVGLEVLRLYEEGGILKNGLETGTYLQAELAKLADHPLVGNVRGRGMLAAVELVADKSSKTRLDPSLNLSKRISDAGKRNRLIFRAFADGIIGIAPPLTLSKAEADLLIERLSYTLDDVAHGLAQ